MWSERKNLKDPILSSFGSHKNMTYNPNDEDEEIFAKKDHDYKEEEKSKFCYMTSDQIPAKERIGRSKFYGTAD